MSIFSEGVPAHSHTHQADALQALRSQQRMRLVIGCSEDMPQQRHHLRTAPHFTPKILAESGDPHERKSIEQWQTFIAEILKDACSLPSSTDVSVAMICCLSGLGRHVKGCQDTSPQCSTLQSCPLRSQPQRPWLLEPPPAQPSARSAAGSAASGLVHPGMATLKSARQNSTLPTCASPCCSLARHVTSLTHVMSADKRDYALNPEVKLSVHVGRQIVLHDHDKRMQQATGGAAPAHSSLRNSQQLQLSGPESGGD